MSEYQSKPVAANEASAPTCSVRSQESAAEKVKESYRQAHSEESEQENLSGDQHSMNQNLSSDNVQDSGQAMPEDQGIDQPQQKQSGKIQENEKSQQNSENDQPQGSGQAKYVKPKNTGGTKDHVKEQPDTGELGGLTGKQPVGKIDVEHL